MRRTALIALSTLAVAYAQQVGTQKPENHPPLNWQTCTVGGSCTTKNGKVVLDANWRWLHTTSGYTNCYTGNSWDTSLCPNPDTCAQNCALDGADYSGTYGITTSGSSLKLNFVTNGQNRNVGSRVYLMETDTSYQMFGLLNKEFTFDVDVSKLPCGLNGALYFSEMDQDGGMAKFPSNKAGAKFGTGYCDAQCPRDIKFINGKANVVGWAPDANSANTGKGSTGACCNEMDIWEANSMATAYTPHPCNTVGLQACTGADCQGGTTGLCDPAGCDFNSFRMGDQSFFGAGLKVDSSKPMTVVTQFLTNNNATNGDLVEIRRLYVQNGKVIQNSKVNIPGMPAFDSITDAFCTQQKQAFNDLNTFGAHGGMQKMGGALGRGMVLVLSIWDDYTARMLWLDSNYPTDRDPSQPGVRRGNCATTSGVPAEVEVSAASASVTFSNIKFGPIGSTFSASGSPPPPNPPSSSSSPPTSSSTTTTTTTTTSSTSTTSSSSSSSAPAPTQTHWGQCGGQNWNGPTVCATGFSCVRFHEWYSQCL